MKTALAELIEKLSDAQRQIMGQSEYANGYDGALSDCINIAELLLEKEKQQITLGWIDGKETYGYGFDVFTDAEFYYHKKYIESEM